MPKQQFNPAQPLYNEPTPLPGYDPRTLDMPFLPRSEESPQTEKRFLGDPANGGREDPSTHQFRRNLMALPQDVTAHKLNRANAPIRYVDSGLGFQRRVLLRKSEFGVPRGKPQPAKGIGVATVRDKEGRLFAGTFNGTERTAPRHPGVSGVTVITPTGHEVTGDAVDIAYMTKATYKGWAAQYRRVVSNRVVAKLAVERKDGAAAKRPGSLPPPPSGDNPGVVIAAGYNFAGDLVVGMVMTPTDLKRAPMYTPPNPAADKQTPVQYVNHMGKAGEVDGKVLADDETLVKVHAGDGHDYDVIINGRMWIVDPHLLERDWAFGPEIKWNTRVSGVFERFTRKSESMSTSRLSLHPELLKELEASVAPRRMGTLFGNKYQPRDPDIADMETKIKAFKENDPSLLAKYYAKWSAKRSEKKASKAMAAAEAQAYAEKEAREAPANQPAPEPTGPIDFVKQAAQPAVRPANRRRGGSRQVDQAAAVSAPVAPPDVTVLTRHISEKSGRPNLLAGVLGRDVRPEDAEFLMPAATKLDGTTSRLDDEDSAKGLMRARFSYDRDRAEAVRDGLGAFFPEAKPLDPQLAELSTGEQQAIQSAYRAVKREFVRSTDGPVLP